MIKLVFHKKNRFNPINKGDHHYQENSHPRVLAFSPMHL